MSATFASLALPTEWRPLLAVVLALGLRHGLDADHLAAIDALTRLNARHRSAVARYCGALFSLGHGAVVVSIALIVGALSLRWQPPEWLNLTGATISIGFLIALGVLNLRTLLTAPAGGIVLPVGLRSRWLSPQRGAGRAWVPVVVGTLFAISFDTISQAALFAVAAVQFGGLRHALVLGLIFTLGMLVTDGANGLWVSRLIARSDATARISSRVMSLTIAGLSLLVAGIGAAQLLSPVFARWSGDQELSLGALVIGLAIGGFGVGRWLAAKQGTATPQGPGTTGAPLALGAPQSVDCPGVRLETFDPAA